ncbi:MAG TPA: hypothetical protein PK073_12910 [Ignavibacteriaceae bacterium]|nr:MAG: hypothetical protein BWY38_00782 [Ignavibacteria bacterium ADurb.Bin266]OQY75476.1 MAG: hypothetical protein B6D44_01360 [Ignavibacteriales bacterium UTCHB2]HQF43804.1 hypothetical protein [Ignavibacteriaceae bacterium]HQI39685.1 hypothetical protein [Ignavibacteriaceae bacterium]HQJ45118.1 hypothetical protein [Ignavibacteriaceae bacterium]
MNLKIFIVTVFFILGSIEFISFAQNEENKTADTLSHHSGLSHHNSDLRYSVFGPPAPDQLKFQLSFMNSKKQNVSAFNFYRKNQRDKVLFLSLINNGLDNTSQYRVRQISGGAAIFPFNDDDRYQLEAGGTVDKIIDTSFYNTILFSRFTYRPVQGLWLRIGFEYYNGYQLGHGANPYINSDLKSYYFSAKYNFGFLTPMAVIGSGQIEHKTNNRFGAGTFLSGPFNLYAFGGYIKSTDESENISTFAIGRWTPFRYDYLPSGFFVWKHKSDYDFQLGGIFFGNRNLFVQPAALGMVTGMFVSSVTLRVNSQLRQRKLLAISEDYESFDYSLFYVHLNQKINDAANNIGFTAFQFYKLFSGIDFLIFSDPVLGLFYTEETNPLFDLKTFKLVDNHENYISYQIGFKIFNDFLFELIHYPSKKDFKLLFHICYCDPLDISEPVVISIFNYI